MIIDFLPTNDNYLFSANGLGKLARSSNQVNHLLINIRNWNIGISPDPLTINFDWIEQQHFDRITIEFPCIGQRGRQKILILAKSLDKPHESPCPSQILIQSSNDNRQSLSSFDTFQEDTVIKKPKYDSDDFEEIRRENVDEDIRERSIQSINWNLLIKIGIVLLATSFLIICLLSQFLYRRSNNSN